MVEALTSFSRFQKLLLGEHNASLKKIDRDSKQNQFFISIEFHALKWPSAINDFSTN